MVDLPAMDGNDPARASFPADDRAVATALAFVRRVAAGQDEDLRVRLAIVVEELVANLIDHGDAAGTIIDLTLARMADGLRLTLDDRGRVFDPRLAEPPTAIPPRGGGAGLALVAAFARSIYYQRENGFNRLELLIPSRR